MNDTLDGWVRPSQVFQLSLFPDERDEFLARAMVSQDELERWRKLGWISFDAREKDEFQTSEGNEILFVRNLARSGLSDAQITELLSELPKPYSYPPTRTAYSFEYGWVQPDCTLSDEDVNGLIEEGWEDWLKALASRGEVDELIRIRDRIDEAIQEATVQEAERSNNRQEWHNR
jgi:hypothetical protein